MIEEFVPVASDDDEEDQVLDNEELKTGDGELCEDKNCKKLHKVITHHEIDDVSIF